MNLDLFWKQVFSYRSFIKMFIFSYIMVDEAMDIAPTLLTKFKIWRNANTRVLKIHLQGSRHYLIEQR